MAMAVAALSGCGGNVLLGTAASSPALRGEPPILRLYYDRNGSLYPGDLLHVPTPDSAFAGVTHHFLLEDHFKAEMRDHAPSFWLEVLDSLRLARNGDTTLLWTAIQDSLVRRASVRLTQQVGGEREPKKMLVVLVHGFNNTADEAETSYRAIRKRLVDSAFVNPARTTYLQVYWDGLTSMVGVPVWTKAQFNFPLVGFAFRRVLNTVDRTVPIRILTHSSGGPLIANTLWNAVGSMQHYGDPEHWPQYRLYFKHVGDTDGEWAPPHNSDLRVGMIVPSMPGSTFDSVTVSPGSPARVVIGVNPHDLAITKFGRVPVSWKFWTAPCVQKGSTCLAARPSDYCERAKPSLERLSTEVRVVDFSKPKRTSRDKRSLFLLDRHDLLAYLQRPRSEAFFSLLFKEGVIDSGDDATWCADTR